MVNSTDKTMTREVYSTNSLTVAYVLFIIPVANHSINLGYDAEEAGKRVKSA